MKVNDFPFGELLKRSWQWTIKNKILWIIAFFAGGGSYFMNMSFNNSDIEAVQNILPQMQKLSDNVSSLTVNSGFIIFIICLIVVIAILFVLLGLAMRAAMVLSAKEISLSQKYKFWSLVKKGFSYLPKLLWISVLWIIPNLVFVSILIVGLLNIRTTVGKVFVGVATVLGLIYNVYVSLLRQNAYCFAVLENNTAWNSILNSAKLLNKNFWIVILSALIEIGLGIAIGLGLIISLILIAIPFVILGALLMFAVGSVGILVPIFLGAIVVIGVMVILRGATGFFFNVFFVNVFWELRK